MTDRAQSPFWRQVADTAASGRIPYVTISSKPLPIIPGRRGAKKTVNPLMPYSHYRTRLLGGRRAPRCALRGCLNQLKKNDVLCCSPECAEHLLSVATRIVDILTTKPEVVYADFLDRGIGGMTSRKVEDRETDDSIADRGGS